MVVKKRVAGETDEQDLWKQQLITPISMTDFIQETADTEKMLLFSESGAGKTSFYLSVLKYLKDKKGIEKDNLLMCIVYPDRSTGITKIQNLIPREFLNNIFVFPINTYEEMVSSTAVAEQKLKEHYKKTGKFGWLIIELLEESWRFTQDYYSRKAFGESLADLMATKRQEVKAMMDSKDKAGKETAYQALEGYKDWVTIKFYHNFNWIDKIKKMPFNVIFTSEVKKEDNEDSIFSALRWRPAGEKDNIHRVDTVLYLSHKGNDFFMKPFKLTGYTRLYSEQKITGKNGYSTHRDCCDRLEDEGYCVSKITDIEMQAGITPPKKKEKKEEKPSEEKVEEEKTEEKTEAKDEPKSSDDDEWEV